MPRPPRPPPRKQLGPPIDETRRTRDTLPVGPEGERRNSVRTLFEVRARVGLVWALIALAFGAGAYLFVRLVSNWVRTLAP